MRKCDSTTTETMGLHSILSSKNIVPWSYSSFRKQSFINCMTFLTQYSVNDNIIWIDKCAWISNWHPLMFYISIHKTTYQRQYIPRSTVYPKKYAHGFCFAVLCCGYTLTDFPISIRLTSLALWQSNDCPSASKATLMNIDKYFMWIHYERLHNHNKAKHNKTMCIFFGIYCTFQEVCCWYVLL